MSRSPKQILDQTHDLAVEFYALQGYDHNTANHGYLFDSQHPTEQLMWHMACMAQLEITETDVNELLSEYGEDYKNGELDDE